MENVTIVSIKTKLNALRSSSMSGTVAPVKKSSKSPAEPTLGVKFISAGLAACVGDLVTFPLDTAKVRLQIQGEGATATTGSASAATQSAAAASVKSPQYRGLVGTICSISRQEGPRALYNGLCAGLQRQMCFASVRIGLYDSVKTSYARTFQSPSSSSTPMAIRMLAGCTTGAMAVACAQPTDVVKVRMQAQRGNAPKRYSGVIQAYRLIGKSEGVRGLWKGMTPNIARNAIVNCSELVSYDMIKETILHYKILSDSMPCHFVSAFGAGFITTIIASPVDVVKTRIMNSAPGTYNGVINCAVLMGKQEGFKAFYKGFTPSFTRLAAWNVVMFVCYEQLKRALTSELPSIEIEVPPQKRYI